MRLFCEQQEQRNKHMETVHHLIALLEKTYSMTLVVIVGAYNICLQTAAKVRRINKTNVAAQFKTEGTV